MTKLKGFHSGTMIKYFIGGGAMYMVIVLIVTFFPSTSARPGPVSYCCRSRCLGDLLPLCCKARYTLCQLGGKTRRSTTDARDTVNNCASVDTVVPVVTLGMN